MWKWTCKQKLWVQYKCVNGICLFVPHWNVCFTGVITVLGLLDFETTKEYLLTLRAIEMNTGAYTETYIRINIEVTASRYCVGVLGGGGSWGNFSSLVLENLKLVVDERGYSVSKCRILYRRDYHLKLYLNHKTSIVIFYAMEETM